MPRVLLIRSLKEAFPLIQALSLKGVETVSYPFFEPHFCSLPALKNPQALLITSKNALRAIDAQESLKKIRLYVVGDQTAKLAQDLGFSEVISASGTSHDLQKLILAKAHREKGVLYHLSGHIIKRDIVTGLQNQGFKAERHVVYRIKDINHLPKNLIDDFLHNQISHVMLFSSRTTHLFGTLLKKNKIEKTVKLMTAMCFSQDIAREAECLSWGKIWISPRPNLKNMLEYFDDER
ncbi:MAG: uroporphyrinogen-III synthase [Proteobacteria bacterium]|nr:uroporphyrinogen-III synthase [Pseudomonadota bacterium]